MAKHCNIKGAAPIIEKAIGIVSDYDRYAEQAGVCGFWRNRIKELLVGSASADFASRFFFY